MEEKRGSAKTILADIFLASRTGVLSEAQFVAAVQKPKVRQRLASIGMAAADACDLFRILDSGQLGTVSYEQYEKSFTHVMLNPGAMSKDLLSVQCQLQREATRIRNRLVASGQRMSKRMTGVHIKVGSRLAAFEQRAARLRAGGGPEGEWRAAWRRLPHDGGPATPGLADALAGVAELRQNVEVLRQEVVQPAQGYQQHQQWLRAVAGATKKVVELRGVLESMAQLERL
mmetsp:Transcript_63036/g.145052  ORF Transcript_63036/g.145052 Transcript_63036/m.145052 type:complete len:230 (+) Transcript_63036:999-1688(+)